MHRVTSIRIFIGRCLKNYFQNIFTIISVFIVLDLTIRWNKNPQKEIENWKSGIKTSNWLQLKFYPIFFNLDNNQFLIR
jgi:hypothetical protein